MDAKYRAYLLSPAWARRRNRVIERAGKICERCRRNPGTVVHHLTYERIFHERLADLQLMCTGCHAFVHGIDTVDPRRTRHTLRPASVRRVRRLAVRQGRS